MTCMHDGEKQSYSAGYNYVHTSGHLSSGIQAVLDFPPSGGKKYLSIFLSFLFSLFLSFSLFHSFFHSFFISFIYLPILL